VVHFGGDVWDKFGGGDGIVFRHHIMSEDIGDGWCVQHACLSGLPEIEEVTTFAALVKGAEFGA
jgi:hypothetical protein